MKIAVLMSCYNGEKYLHEQIQSILEQSGIEVELYVRDDGSTDSTVDLLNKYTEEYTNIHFINKDCVINVGVKDSFFALLDYVYKETDTQFFSFADQDDVWLPEKLVTAVKMILEYEDNPKGALYYSNKTFVDSELNTIFKEKIPVYNDFNEVLWKNRAAGCTMVFDRNLAHFITRKKPECDCIHDGWIYRVAKSIGSSVVFDSRSYILYRQHGNNTVGIKGTKQYHENISYWMKRFVPMIFEKRNYKLLFFMTEIYEVFQDDLTDESKKKIGTFIKYRTSIKSKIQLLLDNDVRRRSRKDRIIWTYKVIFNWLQ